MFDTSEFIDESITTLRETIDDVAIIACSGGVDSTVAAVIANQAVGDLLHCVYVDTGFMRKGETEDIEALLAAQGIKNLVTVKAADRYFEALRGVTEPEQKRKVIGELFIRIFEDEQKKVGVWAKACLTSRLASGVNKHWICPIDVGLGDWDFLKISRPPADSRWSNPR